MDNLSSNEISFEDVKRLHIGYLAKRDGLSFKDTHNTQWWVVWLDQMEPVGLFGVIKVNPRRARLKSIFVAPEWRRFGMLDHIQETAVQWAADNGYEEIVAIVRPNSKAGLLKYGWDQTEKSNVVRKWLKNPT